MARSIRKGLHRKEDSLVLSKNAKKIKDVDHGSRQNHQESAYKFMLEQFDHFESRQIKEVKTKKQDNFYSALKECSWNSATVPTMSFDRCQYIQDVLKGQYSGSITCFAFSPSDHRKLLVVGTDTGEVIEVDQTNRKIRKIKVDNKVLSLDICSDNEKWIAGLDNGEVYIKKTYGGWTSKRIKIDDRPIN